MQRTPSAPLMPTLATDAKLKNIEIICILLVGCSSSAPNQSESTENGKVAPLQVPMVETHDHRTGTQAAINDANDRSSSLEFRKMEPEMFTEGGGYEYEGIVIIERRDGLAVAAYLRSGDTRIKIHGSWIEHMIKWEGERLELYSWEDEVELNPTDVPLKEFE